MINNRRNVSERTALEEQKQRKRKQEDNNPRKRAMGCDCLNGTVTSALVGKKRRKKKRERKRKEIAVSTREENVKFSMNGIHVH